MILVDLFLETGRKAQDQSNANNADAGGKGSQKGSSFLVRILLKDSPSAVKKDMLVFFSLN